MYKLLLGAGATITEDGERIHRKRIDDNSTLGRNPCHSTWLPSFIYDCRVETDVRGLSVGLTLPIHTRRLTFSCFRP